MTSTFVSWVDDWFNHPGSIQTPTHDRIACYIATVMRIGDLITTHREPSRKELQSIHYLLTYLLLGWNPITAWPKKSEFSTGDNSVGYPETVDPIKNLLNFEHPAETRSVYPLLIHVSRACSRYSEERASDYLGECLTMLILGLWLIKRNTCIPSTNRQAIRACLDLYYTSQKFESIDIDTEYAHTSNPLKYCAWMSNNLDRLFKMNISNDELLSTVAYLGWFSSLVRASRVIGLIDRTSIWKQEVATQLSSEADRLRTILDESPLTIDCERSVTHLNLFGLKVKKTINIKTKELSQR